MLLAAILTAVAGFALKLIAAQPAGWYLVPLAAVACLYHIRVHALAARAAKPPERLPAISNVCLFGALLLQLDYTPGYTCAWYTVSGVEWRLGLASEEGCIPLTGVPAILVDIALYIPVAVTWRRLRTA